MRLDFSGQRVLAVMAHPDDLELLCAGTLARAHQDGAAVGVCVMCQGDKGRAPQQADSPQQLALLRQDEVRQALKLLDPQAACFFLQVPDSQLADTLQIRQQLMEVFRRFRPTLVITHYAQDYHADHRATAQVVQATSWIAASAGQASSHPPLQQPPGVWMADTVQGLGFEPHFYLDISPFLELKRRMLRCHESQVARATEEAFADLEQLLVQQAQWRGSQSGVEAAEAFQWLQQWKRVRAW